MPICNVEGYRISVGPIHWFPIVGSEIPVQTDGRNTQVTLTQEFDVSAGEPYGLFAELTGSNTVRVYEYDGVIRGESPVACLMGQQINEDSLTRGRLRWIREKKPLSFLTEASQLPGSRL